MKAYYSKELPDQALFLRGKAYRFDIMETEDASLIQLLDACAAKRIGGVQRISEEQYNLKKKALQSSPPSQKQWKREEVRQKVFPTGQRFVSRKPSESAAASAKPAATPIEAIANAQDFSSFIPKATSGVFRGQQ